VSIPDEAVAAAIKAMEAVTPQTAVDHSDWLKKHGRHALLAGAIAAAAPHIQAQALREAAAELVWVRPEVSPCGDTEACCGSVESCDAMRPSVRVVGEDWLRARADRIEKGEGA
jgi:hypothetical protein